MLQKMLRVSIALERDAEEEQVLAAIERSLGRPLEPVWRLRSVPVLSVRMTSAELEQIRRLPGVRSAEEERRNELPPRPGPPGGARE